MPHQCIRCGKEYPDGSEALLSGCSCGAKFFFFFREKMPEKFAEAKFSHINNESLVSKYLKETYGCFVYQENVMTVCREMAQMTFDEIDVIMKGYNTAIANRANVNERL